MPPSKGLVLLYQPHFVPPSVQSNADYRATPPLSFLALGGPLQEAGYEVRLLDAKWDHDAAAEIRAKIGGAVALGITSLTGYSVYDGLTMAALAKEVAPEVPVIWGGWHPSFATEHAIADPRVDFVVRGPGERTFVELLDALREGRSYKNITGLAYREDDKLVETLERPREDLNQFPPPAYDLVDVKRYIRVGPGSVRHANTILSRGCPYLCDFCLDSRTKWFGLSIERSRQELEFWVLRHGVNHLRLYDGNFFLGRQRIEEFSRMVIDSDLAGRFEWVATGVAHRMSQMDGELLDLLRRAGCAQVAIGAESGSDELLSEITNKTTVEQTIESVRRLTAHGINQYLFFIVGFPEEPAQALEQTLDLIIKLKKINPAVELFINFCVPLPGSKVFTQAVQMGLLEPPRQFSDWAALDYTHANMPHITPAYEAKVKRFMSYLSLAYPQQHSPLNAAALSLLRRSAKWRLERKYFDYPVEAALIDRVKQLRNARAGAN